jgi:hypothetical protein
VEARWNERRLGSGKGSVEEGEALLGRERGDAEASHAREVRFAQRSGHAATLGPDAKGERQCRKAGCPAMMRKRVEEGVGSGVVALPCAAQHTRERGEEHEDGQGKLSGQLVQVQGGIHLGSQDTRGPLGGQRAEDAVLEHASGVDDAGQGVVRGNRREQLLERVAIGDIAGHHRDARAHRFQLGHQGVGSRATATLPRGEKEVPDAVPFDEVPSHAGAERARGAGDEHRAFGIEGARQDDLAVVRARPDEPRHTHDPLTHDELGLARGDSLRQSAA